MKSIDLRGVSCPTNFVKAKLALELLETGDQVEFLLDDGEPIKNVPRSLKSEGHKLLELKEHEKHYILTMEKGEEYVMSNTRSIPTLPANPSPQEILQAGVAAANGPLKLACSFSVEDLVIIDLIRSLQLPIGVFAIDTGRLNEETYEVADAITDRYRIAIDWYFPKNDAVECLLQAKGPFSFRESLVNRQECCQVRKVEPLSRALAGLGGWVTGLRREQSVTRADLAPIEIDATNGGILKINPLLNWSSAQVWDHAKEHGVPVNRLHRQGYPSIGCAPCTRPVQPGEDERAGRWWWENPENKECGLHKR